MRNTYEKQKLSTGYTYIIGCDEVGRGCLAGPVVAAAVVLDPEKLDLRLQRRLWFWEVNDSKQLTAEQRNTLDGVIKSHTVDWRIGVVKRKVIDEINIHHASLLAMKKAVESLSSNFFSPWSNLRKVSDGTPGVIPSASEEYLLSAAHSRGDSHKIFLCIDGKFTIKDLPYEQEAIVDGDAKILSVAAASIIAKVYRDNVMRQLDKEYPAYQFAQHKGYATPQHRTAIKKFGLTPLHRLSFCAQYM